MANEKQKKKGLGLFFWVSFITAIAIMFGLMFQTAMLVKTAKADENSNINIDKFASDFDFVKYSYRLETEFSHGDDFSVYGSCTNTITSCCDEVVPYIKDGDTVTIKREPCCYDYDDNGQMIVEDWNFDLLEISYLPVVNGVSYYGGECGNCDTILIYVQDFNATEIVLDISTFENFEVAILDINFYQKAQLKNGEVQYGKYYYFAESSFYPFSMKPCGNYVRIFTDFWSLTYSGDSAYAYGCAHGLYNGTLDSFNELYGNTTLTTNTALNKTNIEYPSNINEDEEKYYFQTGFLSTYINAYNNITLRYYCNMYDETTESIKTYRNLTFYYTLASDEENGGNSSENSSNSSLPNTSVEIPKTSASNSTESGENDVEIVVSIYDHNREYISQFIVNKGVTISLDDIKNACGGVLICEKWEFFNPVTLESGIFNFEMPIENTINLYARMCEVTLKDIDESVLGVVNVEYKNTISLDDIKTACGGELPFERWEYLLSEYDFSKEVTYDFDLYPLNHDINIMLNDLDDDVGAIASLKVYDSSTVTVDELKEVVSDEYKNFKVIKSLCVVDGDIKPINIETTPITQDVYTFISVSNDNQTPDNSSTPTSSDNLVENSSGNVEISGNNGYTGSAVPGDGNEKGCNHKFTWKPINFPCALCGIGLWAYLWQYLKWAVYTFIGVIVVIVVVKILKS